MTVMPNTTNVVRLEYMERIARAVVELEAASVAISEIPEDKYIATRLHDCANLAAVMKLMLLERIRDSE